MNNKTESKKPWYTKWWVMLIIIIVLINIVSLINSKDTAKNYNNSTNTTILNNNRTENNIVIDGFLKFTSEKWGFSVLFPEEPKENILKLADLTVYNFQSHKLINEENFIQYNCNNFKGIKILAEDSIKAFLDNYALAKASTNNGKLINDNDIIFQGFPAREYTYIDEIQNIETTHKGVVFIVDGDVIELSVAYPSTLNVKIVEYENFKKSFRLEAIHESLTQEYWSNGIIKLKLPISWDSRDKLKSLKKAELIYANKSGHFITLYEAKIYNQGFSCNDLRQEVGSKNIDDKGYMYRTFPSPDYDINLKMISKCIEKDNQGFILSGNAPENTFFRSQLIFEEVLNSFSFK